ncbi:MAG: DUF349 domain-containing protein [Gammaproteobacteria bacterium]|nr:DUF349 domain-containing protein [Gammaproteobacteria bacterium]
MIFSRLFRPAWSHPDARKRLAAVASLDPASDEERRTLRELAFNDGDRQVRLAALQRLDTLELWYLAGHQDADVGIRKSALARVSEQLCDAAFDDNKRSDFVGHCKDSKLVESLWRQLPSASARRAALTRLNKERLFADAAESDGDAQLRQWAVTHVSDDKLLQRLARKASDNSVVAAAQQLLDERDAAARQLAHRAERLRLLLAKINAWSEKLAEPQAVNQQQLGSQSEALLAEWQQLRLELDGEQQHKGDQLAARLADKLSGLQQQWQAAIDLQQRAEAAQAKAAELEAALRDHSRQLDASLAAGDSPDLAAAAERLQRLDSDLSSAELQVDQLRHLRTLWQRAQRQLVELADYGQRLAEARQLIAELAAVTIDSDGLLTVYPAWLQRWSRFDGLTLPAADAGQLAQLRHDWQAATQALRKAADERAAQLRRLFARMTESQRQGRLKQMLKDFEQARGLFEQLPEAERLPLQKRYDEWAERAAELSDWHLYVARPKQEELLVAIEALAAAPLSDPQQQASEVRELRQQWRTLSAPTGDPVWQVLADRFEQASETAFAPCREFYAQLEQEREANRQAREALIAEVEALLTEHASSPLAQNELESRYRKLSRRWQGCGEVDYTVRDALNRRYRDLSGQLTELLRSAYSRNQQGKEALINEASALAQLPPREGRERYRDLQQRWRDLGYAGPQDRGLWQRFAAVGDQLRQADEQARVARDAEIAELEKQAQSLLAQLQQASGEDQSALRQQFDECLAQLPARLRQPHERMLSEWQQQQRELQRQAAQNARLADQRALIEVLSQRLLGSDGQLAPSHPLASLVNAEVPHSGEDRLELTIELELAAGLPSPDEESGLRQKIQLQRLKARLEQGGSSDLLPLVKRWLGCGPLTSSDKPLLARLAKVLGVA